MKKILGILIILLLVPLTISAQDFCEGNFDYDDDVDGTDAFTFKEDFGRSLLKNPCPPDGPTPPRKTGQTSSHGTGDDGDLQRGIGLVIPRFTDNDNGTVTDNQTGLIWLKDANCFGQDRWGLALSDCNGLADGSCGLTDGSSAGDWRLPSLFELESLRNMAYDDPCLSNTNGTGQWSEGDPFTNVQSEFYWSSTTSAYNVNNAKSVWMLNGNVTNNGKSGWLYFWPVRGGR